MHGWGRGTCSHHRGKPQTTRKPPACDWCKHEAEKKEEEELGGKGQGGWHCDPKDGKLLTFSCIRCWLVGTRTVAVHPSVGSDVGSITTAPPHSSSSALITTAWELSHCKGLLVALKHWSSPKYAAGGRIKVLASFAPEVNEDVITCQIHLAQQSTLYCNFFFSNISEGSLDFILSLWQSSSNYLNVLWPLSEVLSK